MENKRIQDRRIKLRRYGEPRMTRVRCLYEYPYVHIEDRRHGERRVSDETKSTIGYRLALSLI